MSIRQPSWMSVKGPLADDMYLWEVPPMSSFYMTGLVSDTVQQKIPGTTIDVSIRRLTNTGATSADVKVTDASGQTYVRTLEAGGELEGFFNLVWQNGTTAPASLFAEV